jgi:hypothetical protein
MWLVAASSARSAFVSQTQKPTKNGIDGAMSKIRILSLSMNCAGAEISLGAANTMKQKKGDKYQSVPAALKVRLGSTPVATLIHDSLMA